MEQLQHFSHEHPLLFKGEAPQKNIEASGDPPVLCSACDDPVLGPNYSCPQCSIHHEFILHQSCAQLPIEILKHPMHTEHPLVLITSKSRRYSRYVCDICRVGFNSFSYTCSKCLFDIDIKCASNFSSTNSILHFSHKHILNLTDKPSRGPPVSCIGCLEQVTGPSYICRRIANRDNSCSIHLHKSCAELPREIRHSMHRQHSLMLNLRGAEECDCDACDKDCSSRFTYSCFQCDFNLHLKCASDWKEFQHFNHDHPLLFNKHEASSQPALCSACEDPVLGANYSCDQCCDFILHKSCAKLSREILQHPMHDKHPLLLLTAKSRSYSMFACDICRKSFKSFSYTCSECRFDIDIKCASNFKTMGCLLHFSHKHILTLTHNISEGGPPVSCNGCLEQVLGPGYICKRNSLRDSSCSIVLHQSCAELPPEINHPMHQHLLKINQNGAQECVCHACDQDCSSRFTYNCFQCDFKLHPKCAADCKGFQHFNHEHPLLFHKHEASGKPTLCSACEDPILGPNYSCNQCFKFNLHQSCAQLPREILQHEMHNKHPLLLITSKSRRYGSYVCDVCRKSFTGFSYTCSECNFDIDIKCASNFRNIDCILHFSHKHILNLTDKPSRGRPPVSCIGCLEQVLGPSYICKRNFGRERSCFIHLHKSCAELPLKIQHPMHRLHSLILNLNGRRECHCDLCDQDCSRRFNYSCFQCDFNIDLKCASEKGFTHFSHEHPLMFKRGNKANEYTGPLVVCDGCQDPILGPSYTCISTYRRRRCCFNLHKSCAELHREIQHPVHRQHPLSLHNSVQNIKVRCLCNACNRPCIYRYHCSKCDFNLHLKCASNWQNIIGNASHEHQFIVPPLELADLHINCHICGDYWSGSAYYICSICQLLVHRECASLPRDIKMSRHQHHLKLTWFLEDIYPKDGQLCGVCNTTVEKSRAVYYCHECYGYVSHTTCMIMEYFREEENPNRFSGDDDEFDDAEQIEHFSHPHLLLANDQHEVAKDQTMTCEGCIRPINITDTFYGCTKQEQSCHFFLHDICARLPTKMFIPLLHTHVFTLLSRAPSFDGVFQCYMCGIFNQGFVYSCQECASPASENLFYLDLECSTYWRNKTLKHESHPHQLHLYTEWDDFYCRGCRSKIFFCFSCKKCNFHLCISCVKLPLTAGHRYDNHPLKLTYASPEHEKGQYYCEICEGKRDPEHWFYLCRHCDFDCHPHCILGRYPQVKLGITYKHDAHAEHHVTLVSKWPSPIQFDKRYIILPCEKCGMACKGLVFECKVCNINFHRDGFCGIDLESLQSSVRIEELS